MNKAELIATVSKETKMSRKTATEAVESILRIITRTLESGEKVQLVGFGHFTITNRIPRQTKIPGTDTIINIPAHKTVKFTAGKTLKSALN